MNKQIFLARQGDVLVREVTEIPAKAVKAKSSVVAVGEGHHEHKVTSGVDVMEFEGTSFLSVGVSGRLVHVHTGTDNQAEHLPIDLPAGLYEVVHQQQYNPYEKAIESVRD